jgi:hypothetical protein
LDGAIVLLLLLLLLVGVDGVGRVGDIAGTVHDLIIGDVGTMFVYLGLLFVIIRSARIFV